jgi:hypothetical protein
LFYAAILLLASLIGRYQLVGIQQLFTYPCWGTSNN